MFVNCEVISIILLGSGNYYNYRESLSEGLRFLETKILWTNFVEIIRCIVSDEFRSTSPDRVQYSLVPEPCQTEYVLLL